MIDWINDPMLQNMDPLKIELIKTAAAQVDGKSSKSLPPILMSLIMSANRQGIRFSTDEMTLILTLLKQGKSPQEQQQIDKTVDMVSSMMTKYQK
ncbi:MAG: hypothetical protein Q4A54_12650 [Parabacteroides sp.]|nr:hypothetical protein [Parabacteroides sp.]